MASAGIYNVVDDEPAELREWLPGVAALLGAPKPLRLPGWLVRIAAGPFALTMMTEMRGASNARARDELDWAPIHPSWREGFGAY